MVTIKSYGEGPCVWCGRDKEGVDIATDDKSFVGFFCFADLKRVLKLKTPQREKSHTTIQPTRVSA